MNETLPQDQPEILSQENTSIGPATTEGNAPVQEPPHPIAEAITRFVHRARDIKFSARVFIPVAIKVMEERFNRARKQVEEADGVLGRPETAERVHGIKRLQEAMHELHRLNYSELPDVN